MVLLTVCIDDSLRPVERVEVHSTFVSRNILFQCVTISNHQSQKYASLCQPPFSVLCICLFHCELSKSSIDSNSVSFNVNKIGTIRFAYAIHLRTSISSNLVYVLFYVFLHFMIQSAHNEINKYTTPKMEIGKVHIFDRNQCNSTLMDRKSDTFSRYSLRAP